MHSFARPAGLILLLAGVVSCGGGPGGTTGPVATHLAFGPLQDNIVINTTFNPHLTVEVHDANGDVVEASSADILIYIRRVSPQPLSGTLALRAVHGIATFADVIIDSLGTYQIVATSSGLDSTTSPAITVHTPAPPPTQVEIRVGGTGGAIQFSSVQNHSVNPAVDTVQVNGSATFTWAGGDHGVHSFGDPLFQDSDTTSVVGHEYSISFPHAGSYFYNCLVHGGLMNGKIVVVDAPGMVPQNR